MLKKKKNCYPYTLSIYLFWPWWTRPQLKLYGPNKIPNILRHGSWRLCAGQETKVQLWGERIRLEISELRSGHRGSRSRTMSLAMCASSVPLAFPTPSPCLLLSTSNTVPGAVPWLPGLPLCPCLQWPQSRTFHPPSLLHNQSVLGFLPSQLHFLVGDS